MTPDASLYRVSRKVELWTLVVASSEVHAKMVARRLPLDVFTAEGEDFDVSEITNTTDVPDGWRSSIPWCEPGRENMYDDATCEDVIRHAAAQKKAEERWREDHPFDPPNPI
jgi:hypothetical protein